MIFGLCVSGTGFSNWGSPVPNPNSIMDNCFSSEVAWSQLIATSLWVGTNCGVKWQTDLADPKMFLYIRQRNLSKRSLAFMSDRTLCWTGGWKHWSRMDHVFPLSRQLSRALEMPIVMAISKPVVDTSVEKVCQAKKRFQSGLAFLWEASLSSGRTLSSFKSHQDAFHRGRKVCRRRRGFVHHSGQSGKGSQEQLLSSRALVVDEIFPVSLKALDFLGPSWLTHL